MLPLVSAPPHERRAARRPPPAAPCVRPALLPVTNPRCSTGPRGGCLRVRRKLQRPWRELFVRSRPIVLRVHSCAASRARALACAQRRTLKSIKRPKRARSLALARGPAFLHMYSFSPRVSSMNCACGCMDDAFGHRTTRSKRGGIFRSDPAHLSCHVSGY